MFEAFTEKAQDAAKTGLLIATTFFCFLIPAGIIVWQIFTYLRSAVWVKVSLIDGLKWLGNQWSISLVPTNWFGLYEILNFISLPLGLIGIGIVLLILFDDAYR